MRVGVALLPDPNSREASGPPPTHYLLRLPSSSPLSPAPPSLSAPPAPPPQLPPPRFPPAAPQLRRRLGAIPPPHRFSRPSCSARRAASPAPSSALLRRITRSSPQHLRRSSAPPAPPPYLPPPSPPSCRRLSAFPPPRRLSHPSAPLAPPLLLSVREAAHRGGPIRVASRQREDGGDPMARGRRASGQRLRMGAQR
ncbi:hypothetical protein BS78_03G406600 [Paspalum vaginatum]|nr:hypothetical protein BS78_03G406600 [Paspalum vaginatum]